MIVFITLLVLPWSKCKFLVFLYSAPSSAVYHMFALYKYFIISKTLHKCMLFDYIYIYMGEGYMQGLIAVSKLIYMNETHTKKTGKNFLVLERFFSRVDRFEGSRKNADDAS